MVGVLAIGLVLTAGSTAQSQNCVIDKIALTLSALVANEDIAWSANTSTTHKGLVDGADRLTALSCRVEASARSTNDTDAVDSKVTLSADTDTIGVYLQTNTFGFARPRSSYVVLAL